MEFKKEPVYQVLVALHSAGREIIIVSGRDSVCRSETEEWLIDNNVPYSALFMRPEGNKEKDSLVKARILREDILPSYYVAGVFDDRDQVVKMWRDLGLTCLQVNYGDF